MESPASHNVTIQLTDTVGWGGLVFFWLFQRLRQSWKGETDEEEEEEERERQRRMEKARTLTSERTNEEKTTIMSVHSNFPHMRQIKPVSLSHLSPGIFFSWVLCVCVCVKRRVKHRNHGSFYCIEDCVTQKKNEYREISTQFTRSFSFFRKKKKTRDDKAMNLFFFFFNLVSGPTFSEELRSQPRICYFYSIRSKWDGDNLL